MSASVKSKKTTKNTDVRLVDVGGLKLLKYAFDEDALRELLTGKLFEGNREKLNAHVTEFALRLQKLRALFVKIKHDDGGVAIGEVKVQNQHMGPFLNALAADFNVMTMTGNKRFMKLSTDLLIGGTMITVNGATDLIFCSTTKSLILDIGDASVRSLLEFKPPYGAMMSFPWVAWDQTVIEAVQFRAMRRTAGIDKPAMVGITDGIASGIVIAEPVMDGDSTLGIVRIYSRCVKAHEVVLHMLLLMCDLTMEEINHISAENGGKLILTEDEAPSATDTSTVNATATSAPPTSGMVTRSKGVDNHPSSSSETGHCRSSGGIVKQHPGGRDADAHDVRTGSSPRGVLASLTTANLDKHMNEMDKLFCGML